MQDELSEAEALSRQALEIAQRTYSKGNWRIAAQQVTHGQCLIRLARYEEAERCLLESLATLKAALGENHGRTQSVLTSLVDLYEAWEKPDKAVEYRTMPPRSTTPVDAPDP